MDKLTYLIDYLAEYNGYRYPSLTHDFSTFRALMNITMPVNLDPEYYKAQDGYLSELIAKRGITDVSSLPKQLTKVSLFKGDITTLKADAIVTAANREMLGCFTPNHNCIDNAIFSFAGLQLRAEMMEIMKKQNGFEPNGLAKISKAYNLPAKHVIHTVGPIVRENVSKQNQIDLRNCYLSCLKLADAYRLESIVFTCISTGVFGYPIKQASDLAFLTVLEYLEENKSTSIRLVVFNTFSDRDYDIYNSLIKRYASESR